MPFIFEIVIGREINFILFFSHILPVHAMVKLCPNTIEMEIQCVANCERICGIHQIPYCSMCAVNGASDSKMLGIHRKRATDQIQFELSTPNHY